jgi:hypothetical protein
LKTNILLAATKSIEVENELFNPLNGVEARSRFFTPPIASLHWGLFNLKTSGLPHKINPALGEALEKQVKQLIINSINKRDRSSPSPLEGVGGR